MRNVDTLYTPIFKFNQLNVSLYQWPLTVFHSDPVCPQGVSNVGSNSGTLSQQSSSLVLYLLLSLLLAIDFWVFFLDFQKWRNANKYKSVFGISMPPPPPVPLTRVSSLFLWFPPPLLGSIPRSVPCSLFLWFHPLLVPYYRVSSLFLVPGSWYPRLLWLPPSPLLVTIPRSVPCSWYPCSYGYHPPPS